MQKKVKFAGSYYGTYAYHVVVTYKDEVYYSDRLAKKDAVELKLSVNPWTVKKLIERGVLVA